MKIGRFTIALLVFVMCCGCLRSFSTTSPKSVSQRTTAEPTSTARPVDSVASAQQSALPKGAPPLPIFPLILNYDYETKYFMQWIAGCPQYSMITASVSKEEPATIEIVLTENGTGKRTYYSNSEGKAKGLVQAGLNAHFVKIDFKTGEDADERPAFAFGFPDEHGVPIRWRFVASGASSDRGAGARIQAVKAGLLVSYNELGTVAAPSALVQVGDKSYEVEQWDEISKPPYFVGFHGTYSEGITLGVLLNGSENWRVQSAPTDLSEGSKWTLIDDRKFVRQLQITARRGDELTITELADKTPWARTVELVVKVNDQGFALKSMTEKAGINSMRITFTPELNLFSTTGAGLTEHAFQIDQNAHQKVLQGTATLEGQGSTLTLKLRPKLDGSQSRQTVVPKDYVMTSAISTGANGYKIEVH